MRFAFIDAEKGRYPVALLCDVLEVSRSGFYSWRDRPEPSQTKGDAQLRVKIASLHQRSRGIYGSPGIHAELRAGGERVGRKRIERLVPESGLRARQKRRFRRTTESSHRLPVAPNELQRRFEVGAPNEAWVTDVTALWTTEGWLYLAAMLDLFSRRVVGWATSDTNDRALALDALKTALRTRRPRPGLLHHSDRGSPYASDD